MAGPLGFVPVIMAGARAITRVAPKVADRLFKQGKAKPATDVYNTLKSEIGKKTEKGFKAIVKGRNVSRLPTKEANALIKQGKAQNAKSVLKSLENAMKSAKEKPTKPLRNPLSKTRKELEIEGKQERIKYPPKPWDFKQPQQPYEELVKQGRLPKATGGKIKKYKGGGQIKKYKGGKQISQAGTKVVPIKVGSSKPLGVGKALKGWGKGYK